MDAHLPEYELYAIRYGGGANARRSDHFIGGDPHEWPDIPMGLFRLGGGWERSALSSIGPPGLPLKSAGRARGKAGICGCPAEIAGARRRRPQ